MFVRRISIRTCVSLAALLLVLISYFHQGGFFAGLGVEILLTIVLPLLVLAFARQSPRDYGLQLGDVSKGIALSVVLLIALTPFVAYFASSVDFRAYYPHWKPATDSLHNFAIYHTVIAIRVFGNEVLFRGLLLFSLPERHANSLHAIIYMLAHWGKPWLELPYSFGLAYGVGWANLRCRSILPGFLVHYLSNLIFDLFIIFLPPLF